MKLATLVMRPQLTCRREKQKSNEVKFSVIKKIKNQQITIIYEIQSKTI
jgi:hypothetical protein